MDTSLEEAVNVLRKHYARKGKGSIKDMADDIGVSPRYLYAIKNGKLESVGQSTLDKIAQYASDTTSVREHALLYHHDAVKDPSSIGDPLDASIQGLRNLIVMLEGTVGAPDAKLRYLRSSLQYMLDHTIPDE